MKYLKFFESFDKEEGEDDNKLKGHNLTIEGLKKMGHKISNFKLDNNKEVISINNVEVNKWIQENIEETETSEEPEGE